MKAKITNVRLAFPKLAKAEGFNGSDPKFSAAFLYEKGSEAAKALEAVVEEVGKAKWGAKWPAVKKELIAGNKSVIQDGDLKSTLAGYEGMLFTNASAPASKRPLVLDKDRSQLDPASGKPYAGCHVNAVIDVWAQDNNFGKRINASLLGVQFVADGDAFAGGAAASDDDFDDLAEGTSADDFA